ncbi:MAG: hypothetical protein KTR27_01980 [Leptolyngbyaceae cyanobacterium MAG.088]|nr:hypothetical protein [Leptolyngbyaceae cyanobacterium MAG.088]
MKIFRPNGLNSNRAVIVSRPRSGDELKTDLLNLRAEGVDVLVSALGKEEEEMLGLAEESQIAHELGIEFISIPITDMSAPEEIEQKLKLLVSKLEAGKVVGAHCRMSAGRAPTIVSALYLLLGNSLNETLDALSNARGFRIPETQSQFMWLKSIATSNSTKQSL